jgi:DNA-binding IclR family transcriptional regulator
VWVAEKMRIKVGLATADREEMVYLESVHANSNVALRSVVSGQRVPMELTSLGRAYFAVVDGAHRRLPCVSVTFAVVYHSGMLKILSRPKHCPNRSTQ